MSSEQTCPRCGMSPRAHPWIFLDGGMSKVWLSGPWAPWYWRLWDRITGRKCFDHYGCNELAADMVAQYQDALAHRANPAPIEAQDG